MKPNRRQTRKPRSKSKSEFFFITRVYLHDSSPMDISHNWLIDSNTGSLLESAKWVDSSCKPCNDKHDIY